MNAQQIKQLTGAKSKAAGLNMLCDRLQALASDHSTWTNSLTS